MSVMSDHLAIKKKEIVYTKRWSNFVSKSMFIMSLRLYLYLNDGRMAAEFHFASFGKSVDQTRCIYRILHLLQHIHDFYVVILMIVSLCFVQTFTV